MCLSAIIWANIKMVYYGNSKEDADAIGFRDEYIYDYIKDMENNKNKKILNLKRIDKEETRKTFEEFIEKKNKIMY